VYRAKRGAITTPENAERRPEATAALDEIGAEAGAFESGRDEMRAQILRLAKCFEEHLDFPAM
jgi:hypothetical protein